MPDIHLRLGKDMLVLSTPIDSALKKHGLNVEKDSLYMLLFEPEVIEEIYALEVNSGVQCLVAATSHITPINLANASMRTDAESLAKNALDMLDDLKPQHILVEIPPCGLPLDPSSKHSLLENRDTYSKIANYYSDVTFDAFFLNGFTNAADLNCALMGIKRMSDKPIFASVDVDGMGNLKRRLSASNETLEQAIEVMIEYGCDVVGVCTGACEKDLINLIDRIKSLTDKPILIQIDFAWQEDDGSDPGLESRSSSEAYLNDITGSVDPSKIDTLVELADMLKDRGIQFLRAVGDVSPAYAGALVAATEKLTVEEQVEPPISTITREMDLDSLSQLLRDRVSEALHNGSTDQELTDRSSNEGS